MGLEFNFAGGGYEDILLYLISILKHLDLKILIRDHTRDNTFYSCIPHIEGIDPTEEVLDIGKAFYTITDHAENDYRSCERNGGSEESYDIFINLYDYLNFPTLKYISIIASDEHRIHAEALEKFRLETGNVLVIKNYTGAVKRQYENIAYRLGCEKVYALPFSEKDHRSRVLAEYHDRYGFSHISKELEQVLLELTGLFVPDRSPKEIRKAYRRAKGGRN